jgi:hypothetical protein
MPRRRFAFGLVLLALAPLAIEWNVVRSTNPACRRADSWTEDDLSTLFYDPVLHWQKRAHGCEHSSFTVSACCKGRVAGTFRALEGRRSPSTERFVIGLVVGHPDPEVVSRAAETLGAWRSAAAVPALRARLRELLEGPAPVSHEEWMAIACLAWALEQLHATEALNELRLDASRAEGVCAHALAVLESRSACAGCLAPHRR